MRVRTISSYISPSPDFALEHPVVKVSLSLQQNQNKDFSPSPSSPTAGSTTEAHDTSFSTSAFTAASVPSSTHGFKIKTGGKLSPLLSATAGSIALSSTITSDKERLNSNSARSSDHYSSQISIPLSPADKAAAISAYSEDGPITRFRSLILRIWHSKWSPRLVTRSILPAPVTFAVLSVIFMLIILSATFLNSSSNSAVSSVISLTFKILRRNFGFVRRKGRRWLHYYQRLLHVHPLSSRAITAAIIFFFADSIAQILHHNNNKHKNANRNRKTFVQVYSLKRAMRYSVYGLIINGPFLFFWYDIMHRFGPPDDFHGSLLKAFFESLTLEPLVVFMYMVYDTILSRKTWWSLKQTFRAKFLAIWFANTIYWLPANFCNYYVGTPDMRVVFANTCSLFWNIYFSDRVSKWKKVRSDPSSAAPRSTQFSTPSSSTASKISSGGVTDNSSKPLLPV